MLFGTDVNAYDDGRPGYPDEVYSLLTDVCDLRPGTRVVEVGPGTGQATERLLACGASVIAIELSEPLARRLSEKYSANGISVVNESFENAQLNPESCDLFVAATSFHWVTPEIGLKKASLALRPSGWLALWWNYFGDPNRTDPFHEAIQPMLHQRAPELVRDGTGGVGAHPYALDSVARIAEIDATGAYGQVRHEVVSWTGRHTAQQIRTMFGSFSPWLAIEPIRRTALLDELQAIADTQFGGVVERPYLTPMYLARRF